MAERALREADGKRLLSRLLPSYVAGGPDAAAAAGIRTPGTVLQVAGPTVDWAALATAAPWVTTSRLVVKPDQLIKRRGKGGLLALNVDWAGAQAWISERMGTDVTVDGVTGRLTTFLVEPFLPHPASDEYYLCITSRRDGEDILFHHQVQPPPRYLLAAPAASTLPLSVTLAGRCGCG